jgi:excisionase family DNA binding protein
MNDFQTRTPPQEKLLWDIREAGAALSISPWTVRLYIRQHKLRSVRVGRRVLLEPEECRRFLDACKGPQRKKR